MGLCASSKIAPAWSPAESDGNVAWLEDVSCIEQHEPPPWEVELCNEGLCNPPFNTESDQKYSHHPKLREAWWFTFKHRVSKLQGRDESSIQLCALKSLHESSYMQMRAQQWISYIQQQQQAMKASGAQ